MLEAYRSHVAERAALGIVPKPLDAEQVAALVELLKNPPAGEEEFILDLVTNRVPPGVEDASYVKAGFLAALTKGETSSPIISAERATELLGPPAAPRSRAENTFRFEFFAQEKVRFAHGRSASHIQSR